jgi:hypothetical protein
VGKDTIHVPNAGIFPKSGEIVPVSLFSSNIMVPNKKNCSIIFMSSLIFVHIIHIFFRSEMNLPNIGNVAILLGIGPLILVFLITSASVTVPNHNSISISMYSRKEVCGHMAIVNSL